MNIEALNVQILQLEEAVRENHLLMVEKATQLTEACRLLREYGQCDPYSGQPYDEVVEFLRRMED